MKKLLLIACLFFGVFAAAQDFDRVQIEGRITVPEGFDAGGITIYNQTAIRGTISEEDGSFLLRMAAGDSLVFSALQFRELKVVVDQGIIKSGELHVEVYEGLNELPEIVVRPHDLTGNLKEDMENAEAVPLDLPEMSAARINDYDYNFQPDSQTKVHNSAMGTQTVGALNVLGILAGVVSAILPEKKSKKKEVPLEPVDRTIRGMYDAQFFKEVFDLESEEINDFISFAQENGLTHELAKKEREMELLQFLLEQREKYDPGTE